MKVSEPILPCVRSGELTWPGQPLLLGRTRQTFGTPSLNFEQGLPPVFERETILNMKDLRKVRSGSFSVLAGARSEPHLLTLWSSSMICSLGQGCVRLTSFDRSRGPSRSLVTRLSCRCISSKNRAILSRIHSGVSLATTALLLCRWMDSRIASRLASSR